MSDVIKPDDKCGILASDHLVIEDDETGEVLLSINGQQQKDLRKDDE